MRFSLVSTSTIASTRSTLRRARESRHWSLSSPAPRLLRLDPAGARTIDDVGSGCPWACPSASTGQLARDPNRQRPSAPHILSFAFSLPLVATRMTFGGSSRTPGAPEPRHTLARSASAMSLTLAVSAAAARLPRHASRGTPTRRPPARWGRQAASPTRSHSARRRASS